MRAEYPRFIFLDAGSFVNAGDLKRKCYFLAHAVHGESTNGKQLFSFLLDAFALEGDFRILLHVKKVRRPQMVITRCDSRIDAGGLDGNTLLLLRALSAVRFA